MKKCLALFLSVVLALSLAACAKQYKLTVAGDHEIVNELKETYSAGEKVTIQLPTITEHAYALFVNGAQQDMDLTRSNLEFTYFVFPMPSEDSMVEIEDRSISIPEE